MRLSDPDFLKVIELAPLVSIDMALLSDRGILLGKRTNAPAKGFWFVPGGRIQKNETLEDAFRRISLAELGHPLEISGATLKLAATHIYEENVFGVSGIGTHYVNLGYSISHSLHWPVGLPFKKDDQHLGLEWFRIEEALSHPEVHIITKKFIQSIFGL